MIEIEIHSNVNDTLVIWNKEFFLHTSLKMYYVYIFVNDVFFNFQRHLSYLPQKASLMENSGIRCIIFFFPC